MSAIDQYIKVQKEKWYINTPCYHKVSLFANEIESYVPNFSPMKDVKTIGRN